MNPEHEIVMIIINDALICKGMTLLLEDMGFTVISANSYSTIDKNIVSSKKPVLIILSMTFNKTQAVNETIQTIRADLNFQHPIICLCSEEQNLITSNNDSSIIFLPEQTRPELLRKKISEITKALASF